MGRFERKNVIVTGASSGIGRATALAFAAEGAKVFAVGRSAERLAEVAREGGDAIQVAVADVSVPAQARGLVREAAEKMGRIHVLVNNAGIAFSEPVLDISEETWRTTMATNLDGVFFASQEAARHMVAAGGGAIVNVASTNAFAAESPQAHYNPSKAAVVMLTKSFAHELGHLGIRVNCVAPGQTITAMTGDEEATRAFREMYYPRIPLRRASRPEEQAAVILFLASDEASFVNGETIIVDGGQLTGTWYDERDAPPVPEENLNP